MDLPGPVAEFGHVKNRRDREQSSRPVRRMARTRARAWKHPSCSGCRRQIGNAASTWAWAIRWDWAYRRRDPRTGQPAQKTASYLILQCHARAPTGARHSCVSQGSAPSSVRRPTARTRWSPMAGALRYMTKAAHLRVVHGRTSLGRWSGRRLPTARSVPMSGAHRSAGPSPCASLFPAGRKPAGSRTCGCGFCRA